MLNPAKDAMHHQLERTVPIGFTLHNPLAVPCRMMSATSKTVRIRILATRPAWLDVDVPAKTATIRLTTDRIPA